MKPLAWFLCLEFLSDPKIYDLSELKLLKALSADVRLKTSIVITTAFCLPSMPSLIFFNPRSFKTDLATSRFSIYLKNLYSFVL